VVFGHMGNCDSSSTTRTRPYRRMHLRYGLALRPVDAGCLPSLGLRFPSTSQHVIPATTPCHLRNQHVIYANDSDKALQPDNVDRDCRRVHMWTTDPRDEISWLEWPLVIPHPGCGCGQRETKARTPEKYGNDPGAN
jgi:hypothetical protein